MTKKQYLESRISEIQTTLKSRAITVDHRKNQERALLYFQMDLMRELERERQNYF